MTSKVYFFILFIFFTGQVFAQEQKKPPVKKFTFSVEAGVTYTNTSNSISFLKPTTYVVIPEPEGGFSVCGSFKTAYSLSRRWRIDATGGITTEKLSFTTRLYTAPGYSKPDFVEQHINRINFYADLNIGFSYQLPLGKKLKIAPFVRSGYMLGFNDQKGPSYEYLSPGVEIIVNRVYVSASMRLPYAIRTDVPYPKDFASSDPYIKSNLYQTFPMRFSVGYIF